ncbi:MAG: outer membrane beta-barrel protein [Pseudomonadales bacterium]|nr:outer membrane beta-barrel protein [Pseudomonadales bacterium]
MKQLKTLVSALMIGMISFQAHAHSAGDMILRAGAISVNPNEDSDRIDVAGLATLQGVNVDLDTQLGLTGVYMLTDNVGIELLAATPFTHDIKVKGTTIKAGDAKQLPPTISLQYYFGEASSQFRPYAAVGFNTTIFFDEDVSQQLNSALDGIVGLPAGTVDASLELDPSYGLSAEVGFDYMLNDNWMINGAIWYADIDTTATIKTAVANVSFDVDIDPFVYFISVGYKF